VAITFAVVGTIVAEFVGSDSGLGYILVVARGNLDTLTVFAAILWLIAMGFLFYFAVEVAERLCIKGRAARRSHELGAGL
jgi:NitT/TauT family transport system permease protein